MNLNISTVNGLFNVSYFVTFVLLLGFSLLLFGITFYTFLVYSLTPFMPVRSGEIAKWMVRGITCGLTNVSQRTMNDSRLSSRRKRPSRKSPRVFSAL
jgi:hypothetical protein